MMKMLRAISYPLIALALVIAFAALPSVHSEAFKDPLAYKWFFCGICIYLFMAFTFFSPARNISRVFTHELTHAIVGTMFFRKIVSFNATVSSGVIFHSKGAVGDLFISLAPYCLPVYTFAFLLLRLLGAESAMFVFDILIGLTLAFHTHCFALETRPRQTDIKKSGYIRSAMFIPAAWALNLSIILLSIPHGVWHAVKSLFAIYADCVAAIFSAVA